MITRQILSLALGGALLLGLGSVAAGQGPRARIARLKNYLALTDAQVSEITALFKKHQETAFPLRQQVRSKNQELRSALSSTQPDPATVGQIVIARRDLQKQLQALNAELLSGIGAVLTPEQKEKFQNLRLGFGRRGGRGRGIR